MVRVVDDEGNQVGIIAVSEALKMARDRELDLVEVAPNARPPVCRIMDYGKYKYEQSKKARKARQAAHTIKVKTIQFRPKTDDHDYQFKKKHIVTFLEAGNKVKIVMRFRGREMAHQNLGRELLHRVAEDVKEIGKIENIPKMEGRQMSMIVAPRQKK